MWKRYSTKIKAILWCPFLFTLMVSGCSTRPVAVALPSRSTPESEQTYPLAKDTQESTEPNPRSLTSMRFTEQARLYLEARKPDEAIRILERAVNLDPNNGRNYYFLAEAYLLKDVLGQAQEFNRLAGIHLTQDSSWREKVKKQRERIEGKD
jgi:tetratricopeptide (TPR) repeat protein